MDRCWELSVVQDLGSLLWFSYWVICMPWVQGKLALYHQGHSPQTLKEWREWVAVVPQKAELFRGTIRSNLLLGMEENLSDEDLWWALETAQAADFCPWKRRTTRWASGSLWSKFLRWPTSAVDHCACPFEEGSFLDSGWFNFCLGLFDGSTSLKIDKRRIEWYEFDLSISTNQ